MATTPTYSLPYQALEDPPHGPNLGQDLAEAIEAVLSDGTKTLTPSAINPATVTTTGNATVGGNLTVSGVGKEIFTRLTSDLPVSSITYIDTVLLAAVAAGGVYKFDVDAFHKMTTTGDIGFRFTFPTGTLHWGGYISNPATPATTSVATAEFRGRQGEATSPSTSLLAGSLTDGNGAYARLSGLFIASASGTLRLQIGQSTTAGTTYLLAGSNMLVKRVS